MLDSKPCLLVKRCNPAIMSPCLRPQFARFAISHETVSTCLFLYLLNYNHRLPKQSIRMSLNGYYPGIGLHFRGGPTRMHAFRIPCTLRPISFPSLVYSRTKTVLVRFPALGVTTHVPLLHVFHEPINDVVLGWKCDRVSRVRP